METRNSDMIERWKEIPKFPGYMASNHGQVISLLSRPGHQRSAPLRMTILKNPASGQQYVRLHRNKRPVMCYVSRLVLSAFVREPSIGEEAAHLDGDNSNDRLRNLVWVTHKVNHSHRRWHGTSAAHESNPQCKLSLDDVAAIRDGMPHLKAATIAKMFNISKAQVSRIRNNQAWKRITLT